MALLEGIRDFVESIIPSPQVSTQTITVANIIFDAASGVAVQVFVNGLSDVPVAVDWSGSFALQLSGQGSALIGQIVYLVYVGEGQPCIGDTVIKGAR